MRIFIEGYDEDGNRVLVGVESDALKVLLMGTKADGSITPVKVNDDGEIITV